MKTVLNCLVSGMLLQIAWTVSAGEYIPPPTGPYQSTVVIGIVEQDSARKHKIYRFPQEDLFKPEMPHHDLPLPAPAVSEREYLNTMPVPAMPLAPPAVLPQQDYRAGPNALNQWYDPALHNAPWARNAPPQRRPYAGEWNYPANGYGYNQYPGMYSQRYDMLNAPYSAMPSPWVMQPPFNPFTGR
jgi:hypothetical protein